MALKYPNGTHPGSGYIYVICDVCGKKIHKKDSVVINDKYNHLNGYVVCREDADKTNPQDKPPPTKREQIISDPKRLRPDRDPVFLTNENDDRLPGAPRDVVARVGTLEPYIELVWQGPYDVGSSDITGYVIARADPQLGEYTVIQSNTGSSSTYYQDTTGDVDNEYSYKVAAINGFGTGPYSEDAFFPVYREPELLGEDGDQILLEDGDFLYYDV